MMEFTFVSGLRFGAGFIVGGFCMWLLICLVMALVDGMRKKDP